MPCCQLLRVCEAKQSTATRYSHHLNWVFFANGTVFLTDLYGPQGIIYDTHGKMNKKEFKRFLKILKTAWHESKTKHVTLDTNPNLWDFTKPTFYNYHREARKMRVGFAYGEAYNVDNYIIIQHDTSRHVNLEPFLAIVLSCGRQWTLSEIHVKKLLSFEKQICRMFKYGIRASECNCGFTTSFFAHNCVTPLVRRSYRIQVRQMLHLSKPPPSQPPKSPPLPLVAPPKPENPYVY